MAQLADIVSVVISRGTAQISRASFGVPMIATSHTQWSDRFRTYSSVSMLVTLVSEGFAVGSPTYLMAQAMLSQTPRPARIMVGRLDGSWTQQITLTPTLGVTGTVYSGRVNNQPWSHTQLAGATLATVCTAIASAIGALSGVTATGASGTSVVVTASAARTLIDCVSTSVAGTYTIADTTAAGTIAADLATLRAGDSTWYGLVTDRRSAAAIAAISTWADAQRVLYCADTSDSAVTDPASTTDVAAANSAKKRTMVFAHPYCASVQFGAAMLGTMLPFAPGSATWAHKSPAGVPDAKFSDSQQAAALAKKANIITTVAGITDTQWGQTGTDFADNVQAEDWVTATLQEDVYAFLRSAPKIPYTDRSVARLVEVIRAALQRGVQRDVVVDGSIVIDAPLVANVSPTDRANRLLPDVYFAFRLTGAGHTTTITGLVSL